MTTIEPGVARPASGESRSSGRNEIDVTKAGGNRHDTRSGDDWFPDLCFGRRMNPTRIGLPGRGEGRDRGDTCRHKDSDESCQ